jgi:hypothetical protein
VLDQRGRLLRAALGFAGLSRPTNDRALWALRTWLDSWSGIGHVAVGMARRGYDLQLTRYDTRRNSRGPTGGQARRDGDADVGILREGQCKAGESLGFLQATYETIRSCGESQRLTSFSCGPSSPRTSCSSVPRSFVS